MKITLIAPTYLPARRANTIQVMKMAQALTELGHLTQVTIPGRQPEGLDWAALAQQYGLRSRFSLLWLPARPKLQRYDYGLAAVWQARRWQANLVYTRLPQAAALASISGLATIYELHDLPQGRGGPRLLRWFLRGRGMKRLVTISQALAHDLKLHYPEIERQSALCVAPDGVDLERYTDLPAPVEARRRLGLPQHGFTAGYTGHLYPGRGRELLLQMAGMLPDLDFLLVGGEQNAQAELQAAIDAARLQNVYLAGFVPNADLPLYQAACEALLMPYQRRVAGSSGGDIAAYLSPMKLFEYLASRRAILSSDLPVLREVLDSENAILLPPDEPLAWAQALHRLRADEDLRSRLAVQAGETAQRYTWRRRAEKILAAI